MCIYIYMYTHTCVYTCVYIRQATPPEETVKQAEEDLLAIFYPFT